ncbi:hypothetical protein BpHYR1_027103 [Brachionus plicatilis]|uniref:Uncharacterized protein n=1 Tax=Brachionus plicatilis TaxID=10195 RepID=A0A3M7SLM3_BRAPC|nr:hypothetical protein BpHYR1_027103 [Brachionus plicatilis]
MGPFSNLKIQTQDLLETPVITLSINKKQYKKRSFVHNHSIIESEGDNNAEDDLVNCLNPSLRSHHILLETDSKLIIFVFFLTFLSQ